MKLFDNVKPICSLDSDVYTTDTTGQDTVDTRGYSDGMLVVTAGDITGTGTDVYTVTVMEGDDTSTLASTGISVTFTGADAPSNSIESARISGLNLNRKRYLRADLSASATTVSWEGSAVVLLGEADQNPVDNS